ncbi:hypothetical protein H0H93_003055, partial [Arthromyces matolae]
MALSNVQVRDLLDAQKVLFTTINVVRFSIDIGIDPPTTSTPTAILNLLEIHSMADVDVEFFEAVYTRFARPALYNPVSNRDPLVEVIRSLTTALGIPISPYHQPNYGGTLGFFFGHRTNRDVYAVCSRHVVLPEEPVPYTSGIPLHADAD